MMKADDSIHRNAILLVHCPDQRGLVATLTTFIASLDGNIINLDEHVDEEEGIFLCRLEWDTSGSNLTDDELRERFQPLADECQMKWTLHFSDYRPRMAVFVSKQSHCFYDILARWHSKEWFVDIPLVISNHEELRPLAEQFGIDFHHIPITKESKATQEAKELEILSHYKIDFIVLARYMQILTSQLVDAYPSRIINIHHSFLPAFAGARPYHAAHARGVKLIGATSHYVTVDLDAGPILEQDIIRVSHTDAVKDLVRKGKDLEKIVLSRAVWHHLNRNILVYGNRTAVFG